MPANIQSPKHATVLHGYGIFPDRIRIQVQQLFCNLQSVFPIPRCGLQHLQRNSLFYLIFQMHEENGKDLTPTILILCRISDIDDCDSLLNHTQVVFVLFEKFSHFLAAFAMILNRILDCIAKGPQLPVSSHQSAFPFKI